MIRRAVYTALFGGYEDLNDAQATQGDVDFLCFTDDPTLHSDVWRIVVVEPEFAGDRHRSQRRIKIIGHPLLAAYEETLYIDNTISLTGSATELMTEWLADADVAFAQHSFRDSLADEFAVVVAEALDDHHRVSEQWDHYVDAFPDVLDGPVLWGGMIARRHTDEVSDLCSTWFHHVLRYSRRDQLSLPVALAARQVHAHVSTMSNFSSPWHVWGVDVRRRGHMRQGVGAAHLPRALRSQVDAVLSAQQRDAEARQRDVEARQRETEARQLEAEARQREAEARRLDVEARDAALAACRADLEQTALALDAVRSSHSWRVTAPLRRASSLLARVRRAI